MALRYHFPFSIFLLLFIIYFTSSSIFLLPFSFFKLFLFSFGILYFFPNLLHEKKFLKRISKASLIYRQSHIKAIFKDKWLDNSGMSFQIPCMCTKLDKTLDQATSPNGSLT